MAPLDVERRNLRTEMALPHDLAVHVERHKLPAAEPRVHELSVGDGARARQVVFVVHAGQISRGLEPILPRAFPVAAVEGFAIGGHCQIILTMDYTIAANDAYLTLPARKEGIIPGAANLRLPRFVGDRIARQAILAERRIDCDSEAGRLICDEIVPPERMDEAINAMVDRLTSSGVVSAAGNRRAFRAGEEPLDTFRRYMAIYAREQAECHLSPALVCNLERNWKQR